MESLHTPHDIGYKWLLSSRALFMQLLRSFVKQPWVEKIDETKLRRADKSFIAKDFKEKEADLVYEVQLEGRIVVVYLLLELQGKVDFSMPYRLLHYMSGIWQNYLRLLPKTETIEQKNFRLPAIVPIVLYNGANEWTAARSFRGMVDNAALFGNALLDFEYVLLQVNRYEDSELLGLANTIGAAFLLDKNSRKPQELRRLLGDLFAALQNAPEAELQVFFRWMRYVLRPRLPEAQQALFETALENLGDKEGRKMVFANFEKSLDALKEEGRMEGRQEGRQEGQQEGRIEGRREGLEATALEMLRDKMSAQTVAKYTKLPLERIHALMKSV